MARNKVTIEATELLEPDVQFISLVKRGANRIPFRIIKSENDPMINLDLSRIFKREKPPTVLAVIINKAEVPEDVVAIVKEAGFSVDTPVVQDGATIYKQYSGEKDSVAVKLAEDVAILVSADELTIPVEKSEESWGKAFYDSLKCEGFYASIGPAASTMLSTLSYALYVSGSPQEARKAAEEVLGAFSEYTLSMVGAIPANAFRMSEEVAKAMKSAVSGDHAEDSTDEGDAEDCSKQESLEATENDLSTCDEGETTQKSEATDEEDGGEEDAGSDVTEKQESGELSQVVKALTDMTSEFQSLQSQFSALGELVDSVQKENRELREKLDSVESIAKSASQVVLGGETPEDTIQRESSRKSDALPVIDTAFQPALRKQAREAAIQTRNRRPTRY